ncbi:SART-1 protein [Syncephalis pseudoplumigaleata]|uniref:SART-1 protein n=1 Tax=Syncephalis pseudoplumigaleata TaxID=1712513 RepID=A0A4P9YVG7_9FUNG|nr:SART-1 protein [Syncephalis pseudoplumigaleata]|eukprot:RKP23221.1 SART-1 protein [Syncephalis pseudoplumigaleata]
MADNASGNSSAAGEISLSLEETNKLRISLGLKPLEAGPSDATAAAERNYKEQREKEKQAAEAKTIREKIEKMQNRAKLTKKLEGKGLGEADAATGAENSAMEWVRRNRQAERARAKERALAAKRAKQLEEQDSIASQSATTDYSSEQLKGLKVAHDLSEFQEGEEQVLVLKDATIMDNEEEGDQLESLQLAEKSKLERNLENKKKRPIYTGYDDEEFSTTIGKRPAILSHYDEVIDGTKTKSFVLGSDTTQTPSSDGQQQQQHRTVGEQLRLEGESLDYTKEAEVTFKKPRHGKKARKVRRRTPTAAGTPETSADAATTMALDEEVKPEPIIRSDLSTRNLVDDDDLQQALALARNTATRKRSKRNALEEFAEQGDWQAG